MRRWLSLILLVAGLVGGAVACASEQADEPAPVGAIYSAVLAELMAQQPPSTTMAGALPTLFVEPLGDGFVIDLGAQADVVKELETVAAVRFIDNRAEAVDDKLPGIPVRPGGTLLALGPLLQDATGRRTVQVRRYIDGAHADDLLATVTASGASWAVAVTPR